MEKIITIETKEFYNLDEQKAASEWVREESKKAKKEKESRPIMTSSLNLKELKKEILIDFDAIGYMFNKSNSIYKNGQEVALFSSMFSDGHGLSIIPENLHKVTTLFAARKAITGKYANWVNDKDEYLAPDENHPKWEQFVTDSLVYSLFNNSSQQSSLRQVDYKGKKWDIKNEFFWLSI